MDLPKPESLEKYGIYAITALVGLAIWGVVQIVTRKE